jgi:Rrf2 family protein
MFSKTCEYAIRAMIYIAQKTKEGDKVGFKEIANGIDSPEHFIAKILQDLGKKNLVQSAKGPNGGFYLDEQSINICLADIVKAIDGDALFTGCGLGLKYCSESNPCPIHNEFKAIRDQTQKMLQTATVIDFKELLDKGVVHLKKV